MRKKFLLVMLVAVILMAATLLVFSDQNGTDKWCNTDEYGCWVTTEDGGKSYIYFWSEDARSYIMGNGSEPGSNVVAQFPGDPDYGEGKLPLMDPPVYDYYYTTAIAMVPYSVPVTSVTNVTETISVTSQSVYTTSSTTTIPDTINLTTLFWPFKNNHEQFAEMHAPYTSGDFTTTYTAWSKTYKDDYMPFNSLTAYLPYLTWTPVTTAEISWTGTPMYELTVMSDWTLTYSGLELLVPSLNSTSMNYTMYNYTFSYIPETTHSTALTYSSHTSAVTYQTSTPVTTSEVKTSESTVTSYSTGVSTVVSKQLTSSIH